MLRYRNLLVREGVRMKNKVAGLLMEIGQPYVKEKLHRKKYFYPLLEQTAPGAALGARAAGDQPQPHGAGAANRAAAAEGTGEARLAGRAGEALADDPGSRSGTGADVGAGGGRAQPLLVDWRRGQLLRLVQGAEGIGGEKQRGPLSKQRNKHLQTMLIEAAKLAPRYNQRLREVYQRECGRKPRDRATLEVARKLVAYLLAVDRRGRDFEALPPAA